MPVYVYRNLVTNETFEYQQRITEDALTVDPRTGDPVRRVIQPVGIAFKGSGFYVNDSRTASGSNGGSKSSSAATGSDDSSSKASTANGGSSSEATSGTSSSDAPSAGGSSGSAEKSSTSSASASAS